MNDPNWKFDGEPCDDLDAARGILGGIGLCLLVWALGLLIWWWL